MYRAFGPAIVAGLLVVAAGALPASALAISSLVVFGDSNVDIGRAASETDPNDGIVPPPNTVGGRNSDGTILPEFLATRVGVPQLNFAFSGATAGATNIIGFFGFPDLMMTGTLAQITEFAGVIGAGSADPDALYLVVAGSNDLFFADKNDQAAVSAAVVDADANLRLAVTRLTDLGAREIVVATRSPRPVLSDADTIADEGDPAARNDAAGRQLNTAIRSLVAELDAALVSNVMLFDVYDLVRDLIATSGTNGFVPYSASPDQFCVNNTECSMLINHDAAHKTSAVHSVLADRFIAQFELEAVSQPAPIPLPASGLLLAAGVAALGFRRRRGAPLAA